MVYQGHNITILGASGQISALMLKNQLAQADYPITSI